MVLESTMICIDNSEWMRNGDYASSRFQEQADAVNLICGAKTQSARPVVLMAASFANAVYERLPLEDDDLLTAQRANGRWKRVSEPLPRLLPNLLRNMQMPPEAAGYEWTPGAAGGRPLPL